MRQLFILGFVAALSGCAAVPTNSGAERVRITNTEPGKECRFLGDVTGNQGNFVTGPWTSNENLEIGARNIIKNKAFAMGANVVVLLSQRAGQSGSYVQGGGSMTQTNVVLTGNAYRCPE